MILIILLIVILALLLLSLYSETKVNKSTAEDLDELNMSFDMLLIKEADLERRVQVLERKIVSMEGEKDAEIKQEL